MLHIHGNVLTPYGVASNNRGDSDGNLTMLQTIMFKGQRTSVSSEAIKFAIRIILEELGEKVNRHWDHNLNDFRFEKLTSSGKPDFDSETYADDDLMGWMRAEAAKIDDESNPDNPEGDKKKAKKAKGVSLARKGILDIARAVSLSKAGGYLDVTFNCKAGEKGSTSLYKTQVHATRYQYGFSMTPDKLHKTERAISALNAIAILAGVAGNQSRFLYDFSPEMCVIRLTHDPAPRILYCFDQPDQENPDKITLNLPYAHLKPEEYFVGGNIKAPDGVNTFPTAVEAIQAVANKLGGN